jgi:predicted enzyme related to lactoylglutathione lyase
MPRVVHFEIPANNAEKIAAFYRDVFGWQINKWEGGDYWLVGTGEDGTPGIDGGLYTPQEGAPHVTVNTIDVENLDEMLNKVKANGGKIIADKMPVPGVGWLAYCADVEGTPFGLMQADTSVGQ